MEEVYRHSQRGYLGLIIVIGVLVVMLATGAAAAGWAVMLPLAIVVVVVLMMSRLTVVVTRDELLVYFGPGLRVKRVRLDEIAVVRAVENPWWYGWGIRFTPHGVLYNVAGTDAVEIVLKRGRQFRVGTDEPLVLREVLERVLRQR